jgi:hypothetical protein
MKRKMDHLALAEVSADSTSGLAFSGYAAVFDQLSEDMGGFKIVVRPGAFSRSLAAVKKGTRDVRMFLNHEDNIVLGSTHAGTLRLSEDNHGLKAEADLPDNEWGRPVSDAITRGEIRTMSIGFNSVPAHDEWSDDKSVLYKSELILNEVSPITSWAAFEGTSASVFALAGRLDVERYALEEAIDALAAGNPLTAEQTALIGAAVVDLGPAPEPDRTIIHRHHLALAELGQRAAS